MYFHLEDCIPRRKSGKILVFLKKTFKVHGNNEFHFANDENKIFKTISSCQFSKLKEMEKKLEETDGLQEHLYAQICEASILKYQSADLGIDDVIYTDEVVGDEL